MKHDVNVETFKAKILESKMRGGIEFRKRGGGGLSLQYKKL